VTDENSGNISEVGKVTLANLVSIAYDSCMARKRSKRKKLSDQIRHIIETCGVSRYRIAKETGISEPTLSRFMSSERGLTTTALDILADFLDLNITTGKTKGK